MHRAPHLPQRVLGCPEPAASLQSRPTASARKTPLRSRLPGESHYCSGSARPGRRRQRAHTRSRGLAPPQPASRCDRSPATRSKKPALGTEHAPKPSSTPEEFPGEESATLRGSREVAGGGNPFSLELGRSDKKARTGSTEGVVSNDLIPLNGNTGSFLCMRVDRNLLGLVCRNNTPMAGSPTQTGVSCPSSAWE